MNDVPNGSQSEPLHVTVERSDPVVPLALVIKTVVIGVMLATVIPIAVTLYLNHQDNVRRTTEITALVTQNEALTKRLADEVSDRTKAQNAYAFEQCQKGERRDVVMVQQNEAFLEVLSLVPPASRTLHLDRLVQSLQDTNFVLEPPHEKNCTLPPGSGP